MPSNSLMDDAKEKNGDGTLYVVGTPIGNQDDITLRALKILREADLVAAEDTRKTRRFLASHRITTRLISYHEHNEAQRTPILIAKLKKGTAIALVSNAGTPCVSDPGYRLMCAAIANGLPVIPIPGVSAVTTALSVAGLPTDSFVFTGFLSKKKGKRLSRIRELAIEKRTLIFYESPKRILSLLAEILTTLGNRPGVLAREMTKLHEEFIRGRLSQIIDNLSDRAEIKGECTLLVSGDGDNQTSPGEPLRSDIRAMLSAEVKVSEIAKALAPKHNLPKTKVYEEALKISGRKQDDE
jgi:16S rRNA (cytidine1402-2'-O)-methyltransferase